jgi:transcription elongation factor Elf1
MTTIPILHILLNILSFVKGVAMKLLNKVLCKLFGHKNMTIITILPKSSIKTIICTRCGKLKDIDLKSTLTEITGLTCEFVIYDEFFD